MGSEKPYYRINVADSFCHVMDVSSKQLELTIPLVEENQVSENFERAGFLHGCDGAQPYLDTVRNILSKLV